MLISGNVENIQEENICKNSDHQHKESKGINSIYQSKTIGMVLNECKCLQRLSIYLNNTYGHVKDRLKENFNQIIKGELNIAMKDSNRLETKEYKTRYSTVQLEPLMKCMLQLNVFEEIMVKNEKEVNTQLDKLLFEIVDDVDANFEYYIETIKTNDHAGLDFNNVFNIYSEAILKENKTNNKNWEIYIKVAYKILLFMLNFFRIFSVIMHDYAAELIRKFCYESSSKDFALSALETMARHHDQKICTMFLQNYEIYNLHHKNFIELQSLLNVTLKKLCEIYKNKDLFPTTNDQLTLTSNKFIYNLHKNHTERLIRSVSKENWAIQDVCNIFDCQEKLDALYNANLDSLKYNFSYMEQIEMIGTSEAIKNHDQLLTNTKETANPSEGSRTPTFKPSDTRQSKHCLTFDRQDYACTASSVEMISIILSYLETFSNIPSTNVDISTCLCECFETYSEHMRIAILEAGAIKTAGMKVITAKHLTMSLRTLDLFLRIIQNLNEQSDPRIGIKDSNMNAEKIIKIYLNHINDIEEKIQAVMRNRANYHTHNYINAIKDLNNNRAPINISVLDINLKNLATEYISLCKILKRYLNEEKCRHLTIKTTQKINEAFRLSIEELKKEDIKVNTATIHHIKNKILNDWDMYTKTTSNEYSSEETQASIQKTIKEIVDSIK